MQQGSKRFLLRRGEDETGISGIGVVAEGCEFSSGAVALTWITRNAPTSFVWYLSLADVERIHGHQGKTVIQYLDER